MKHSTAPTIVKASLFFIVCCAVALWMPFQDVRTLWQGVPPPPGDTTVSSSALGDTQLGYRMSGLTLQNLGDEGGTTTPLKDYDYERLKTWLYTLYNLDKKSDFAPMLAAYYFGATNDPQDAMLIVDFLEDVGNDPRGEKWRWLTQAVFLARYKGEDTDRALKIAEKLSKLYYQNNDMPIWTLQMPAFILEARGENAAARTLLDTIFRTTPDLSANDVNFLDDRIKNMPRF